MLAYNGPFASGVFSAAGRLRYGILIAMVRQSDEPKTFLFWMEWLLIFVNTVTAVVVGVIVPLTPYGRWLLELLPDNTLGAMIGAFILGSPVVITFVIMFYVEMLVLNWLGMPFPKPKQEDRVSVGGPGKRA